MKKLLLLTILTIICIDTLYYEDGILYPTTICMSEEVYNMQEEIEI
jgi:hypothetical protein